MTQKYSKEDLRVKLIVDLLSISALPDVEKKLWGALLPHMKEEEKDELIENLEAELTYEYKSGKRAGERFRKLMDNPLN